MEDNYGRLDITLEEMVNTPDIIGKIKEKSKNKELSESAKNRIKMNKIIERLRELGLVDEYCDKTLIINVIEENHIDTSKFDFPYGSYDNFKQVAEEEESLYHKALKDAKENVESKVGTIEYITEKHGGFMN